MDLVALAALGAATAVLLVVLGALWFLLLPRHRRLERQLIAERADVAALRQRVEALTVRVDPPPVVPTPEYLITDLSEPGSALTVSGRSPQNAAPATPAEITSGAFASLVLGETLVKAVALGHGLRRALSSENRNRIAFEMSREVKRARKQRRRELKQARRDLRSDQRESLSARAGEDAA